MVQNLVHVSLLQHEELKTRLIDPKVETFDETFTFYISAGKLNTKELLSKFLLKNTVEGVWLTVDKLYTYQNYHICTLQCRGLSVTNKNLALQFGNRVNTYTVYLHVRKCRKMALFRYKSTMAVWFLL